MESFKLAVSHPRWCNSVHAIRPKVLGFKPGPGWWIFKDKKVRSTLSFVWEVTPSAPCRNILRHVKNHFKALTKISHHFLRQFVLMFYYMTLLLELTESSGGPIRSFSLSVSFHHGSPCSYITWGMNNWHVGGRTSEAGSSHRHDHQVGNNSLTENWNIRSVRSWWKTKRYWMEDDLTVPNNVIETRNLFLQIITKKSVIIRRKRITLF
jgi:hypothetical protein